MGNITNPNINNLEFSEMDKKDKIVCPICNNTERFIFIENHGGYKINRCPVCDLTFAFPMKGANSEWYASFESRTSPLLDRWEFDEFLNDFNVTGLKILDLGCGTGIFLKKLSDNGAIPTGVDFDEKTVEIAKKNCKETKILSVDLDSVSKPFTDERFDIITMFHFIEHVSGPVKIIKIVHSMLKENGMIVISFPNPRQIINWRNEWDYPPHHLTRWNEKSITYLLSNNGFEVESIKYEPIDTPLRVFRFLRFFILYNVRSGIGRIFIKGGPAGTSGDKSDHLVRHEKINKIKRFKGGLAFFASLFLFPFLYFLIKRMKLNGQSVYVIAKKAGCAF